MAIYILLTVGMVFFGSYSAFLFLQASQVWLTPKSSTLVEHGLSHVPSVLIKMKLA